MSKYGQITWKKYPNEIPPGNKDVQDSVVFVTRDLFGDQTWSGYFDGEGFFLSDESLERMGYMKSVIAWARVLTDIKPNLPKGF